VAENSMTFSTHPPCRNLGSMSHRPHLFVIIDVERIYNPSPLWGGRVGGSNCRNISCSTPLQFSMTSWFQNRNTLNPDFSATHHEANLFACLLHAGPIQLNSYFFSKQTKSIT